MNFLARVTVASLALLWCFNAFAQESPKKESEKQESKKEECPSDHPCRVMAAPDPGNSGSKDGLDTKGVIRGPEGIISKGVQDVQRTLRLPKF
ncbi:hypothetical protein ACF1BQ_036825 [Bradyrhizobium sp. RDT10]